MRKFNNLINTENYLMEELRKAYSYLWFLDENVSKEFEKVRKDLINDEMEIVERMDKSHYSLYEVEIVEPKEGFKVRDLLKEKEREKIIDIIKDIENQNERRKLFGGISYDISGIWDALGLKEYLYLEQ